MDHTARDLSVVAKSALKQSTALDVAYGDAEGQFAATLQASAAGPVSVTLAYGDDKRVLGKASFNVVAGPPVTLTLPVTAWHFAHPTDVNNL